MVFKPRTFLTAEWRHLAMLNYPVDPAVLKPFVPSGTELDFFEGVAFVSVVGFRFLNTRVAGWGFPFHRNFEEVNLRFYVRRRAAEGWRRGVVFIKEIVPRRAIAFIARAFYGEPYVALPMRHVIDLSPMGVQVEYSWRGKCGWESVRIDARGGPQNIAEGSHEEFITEHYGVIQKRGRVAANIRLNIRAGKSGRGRKAAWVRMWRRFMGDDLSRACPQGRLRHLSRRVRPWWSGSTHD